MSKLYSNDQVRMIERHYIKNNDINERCLMSAAAEAALNVMQQYWPKAERIAIFCGKGNNAGDGFALAALAYQAGINVTVYMAFELNALTEAALLQAQHCQQLGVEMQPVGISASLNCDLIVDALLGLGLTGIVRAPINTVINTINQFTQPVLSLDAPSGLNADTGHGYGCAIQADVTLAYIGYRKGFFTYQGSQLCGQLELATLGITENAYHIAKPNNFLLNPGELRQNIPARDKSVHKNNCGHVLVIGGDYGMGGAIRLASEAAARVGAGLVTVATRPEHVTIVSGTRPEIMCHQVHSVDDLRPLLSRASTVLIGPGLGDSEWGHSLFDAVITHKLPTVVDADALKILSKKKRSSDQWVLTPHPGEAGCLLGVDNQQVQQDRFMSIDEITRRYGGTCVLKGAGSIVKTANKDDYYICRAGNPGMASAGMGDILSGVIAGLLAQGLTAIQAAKYGTLVHSMAADQAAKKGGERGLLASDLLDFLRELVNP